MLLYLPLGHESQETAPKLELNLPSGHFLHCWLPIESIYSPIGQSEQLEDPSIAEKVPALHAVHEALEVAACKELKVPKVQFLQKMRDVAPNTSEYVPDGHAAQDVEAREEV